MFIMREIVQIGHNGELIAERPVTTEIKLGKARPVNHPQVIGRRKKKGVTLKSHL